MIANFLFVFVFVNMGPHGRTNFKRHLVWKYTRHLLPPKKKNRHTLRMSLYQSCIKNCEISNFGFLRFFLFFFIARRGLTWESMGNDKKYDILGTAGRRAKRTKFEPLGGKWSVYAVYRLLSVEFQFGVIRCISNFWQPCILKINSRRVKRTKIWASWVSISCVQKFFDC